MKDAAGAAEDRGVAQGPADPEQNRLGPRRQRRRRARPSRVDEEPDDGQRQQPADLPRQERRRQAPRSGRHSLQSIARADRRRRRVGLRVHRGLAVTREQPPAVPDEALQAVVVKGQLQHRIAPAAADEGPAVLRRQVVGERPGERHRDQHRERRRRMSQAPTHRDRRSEDVDEEKTWRDHQRRQHLDVVADAEERRRQQEKPPAAALGGEAQGPGREQQDQDETALGVGGAIDGDADGCQRQKEGGEQSRCRAETAPDEVEQQDDRGNSLDDLRQQHAQTAEAENPRARRLDPEGERRLVEGHEAAGIEGVEEEVVPALQHAADAGAVIFVAEAVLVEVPAAQQDGEQDDAGEA